MDTMDTMVAICFFAPFAMLVVLGVIALANESHQNRNSY